MRTMFFTAFCVMAMGVIWTAQGRSMPGEPWENRLCGDGMTINGQFFNCTKPLMAPYRIDPEWVKPGYTLNQGILKYLTTYCGMVLPSGAQCLESQLWACSSKIKEFVLDEVNGAGGFCQGRSVSANVRHLLMSLPAASPSEVESCPRVDSSSCYNKISSELYIQEVFFLSAPDLAPHVQRTFESVFQCLVTKYRADQAHCPHWQLNMLWRHAITFMPHPLGFVLNSRLLRPLYP